MSGTAVVLQARMGSSRLPGKVLERLGSKSILQQCLIRLGEAGLPVIVATTTEVEDAPIEAAARAMGAEVFRGASQDVLQRYLDTADAFGLSEVIRATADNPFVDMDASRRVLAFRQRVGSDHAVECGLPVGTAVEAVSVSALRRAAALATDPYDREHVTSLVRRDPRFSALRAVAPGNLRRPGLRLTVDTYEDLSFAREVFDRLGSTGVTAPLARIITVADELLVRAVARQRIRQGA